jgi:hypothetical protein
MEFRDAEQIVNFCKIGVGANALPLDFNRTTDPSSPSPVISVMWWIDTRLKSPQISPVQTVD